MVLRKSNVETLRKLQLQEVENSLVAELLRLFAVFCWVDGVVSKEEKQYVREYLNTIYPAHFSEKLNAYFLSLIPSKPEIETSDSKRIKTRFRYEERFYILFKLYELAGADGIVDEEKEALKSICQSIGVYPEDCELIYDILQNGIYQGSENQGLNQSANIPKVLVFHDGSEECVFIIIRIRTQLFCYSFSSVLTTGIRAAPSGILFKLGDADVLVYKGIRITIPLVKSLYKLCGKTLHLDTTAFKTSKFRTKRGLQFRANGLCVDPATSTSNNSNKDPLWGYLDGFAEAPELPVILTQRESMSHLVRDQRVLKVGNSFIYDVEVFDDLDDDWYCIVSKTDHGIAVYQRSCPHKIIYEKGKWTDSYLLVPGRYIRILGTVLSWNDEQNWFQFSSAVPERLDVNNVSCQFKDKAFGLRDISFSASRGDIVAIMGPSGSGKSTLLKALNMSIPIQSGEINVVHQTLSNQPDIRSILSYTPQDDLLKADLTVYENLLYNCRLRHANSQVDHHKIVHNVLNQVGLYNKKHLRAGEVGNNKLSGGQRKRLNIGLELLEEKDIFLFDEPTTGLSSKDSEKIVAVLKQLSYRSKIVFAVIHQPSIGLLNQFNRLLLLDKGGVLIYYGSVKDAFEYFGAYTDSVLQEELSDRLSEPDALMEIIEQPMRDLDGKPFAFRKYSPQFWAKEFREKSKSDLSCS